MSHLNQVLAAYNSKYRIDSLPLKMFYNNTAHSSTSHCVFIDRGVNQDGSAPGGNPYWGSNSVVFQKTTAYKCRGASVWSITDLQHSGGVHVDSGDMSVFFNGDAAIHDSIFVGSSANLGIVPYARRQCGISTYDVGAPQHSYNNVFINFTTDYKGYYAGGQCGQGSGLQPISRTYNNTYINANPYTMSNINLGKGAFVWNDVDGSSTKIPGGAVVISSNQLISLPANSTGCTYNTTSPMAWVCPSNGYGHVQAAFTDPTSSRSYSLYPATLLNGTVLPAARHIRYTLVDMADRKRTGSISAAGDGLPCISGNYATSCEAILFNMPPKRMIGVKFTYNSDFRASPSQFRLQIGSLAPGDWMYVAIPYPTSARFQLTNEKGDNMTQVSSFAAVNISTFYYDSSTELLWAFLKASPSSFSTKIAQDVSFNIGSSNVVNIQAICSQNLCQPTLSKLQTTYSAPSVPFVENVYYGSLKNSQVVPATAAITGLGFAQIWHYPIWNEIHVAILHDLSAYDPTLSLGVGSYNSAGSILSFPIPGTSLSKSIFQTTPVLISALYTGNLFVQVNTSSFPRGHLRAQLYCSGTCKQPVVMKETNVCRPATNTYYVFNGTLTRGWNAGVYNLSWESFGTSTQSLCGNASLITTFYGGQYQISGLFDLNSTYNYLEFYIKTASGIINPKIWLRTNTTDSISLNLKPYALDGQLDDASGFQLVSIPLADFKLGSAFRLKTLIFNNYGGGAPITVSFDQIRFTTKTAATYNFGTTLVAGVSPSSTTGSTTASKSTTTAAPVASTSSAPVPVATTTSGKQTTAAGTTTSSASIPAKQEESLLVSTGSVVHSCYIGLVILLSVFLL
eukprot:TRINITY_DN5015_c0_g1_i5.p1 TRINITY_DN5015_c0_g1~~TRINITY_DN5015_c0_g1_i5.p1  ORF type:complete len:850 (+),score=150.86 TRINITY_DN5015_c0_g1_i5:28-2577(+)